MAPTLFKTFATLATLALNSPLCRLLLIAIIRPPSNHRISYLTGGPKFGVHYTVPAPRSLSRLQATLRESPAARIGRKIWGVCGLAWSMPVRMLGAEGEGFQRKPVTKMSDSNRRRYEQHHYSGLRPFY
jgi:hypothetical protein